MREADLSGLLGQIVYIDLVGVHDEAASRALLLNGVGPGRQLSNLKPPLILSKWESAPGGSAKLDIFESHPMLVRSGRPNSTPERVHD